MKAAVFYGKGDIRYEDVAKPVPGPGEVLIEVKAAGVCGTDLHIFSGAEGATECEPPVILCHELAGIVTEIGEGVTRVRPGDHVTVDPNISCGSCRMCRDGKPHFCDSMTATGVNHNGGFAEYCKVLEKQVFVLPENLPFEEGAMCEPVSCCIHGMDMCGIRSGDTVMIIGGGTIGLIMLQLSRMTGATTVILTDTNDQRLSMGKTLGADVCINPVREKVEEVLERSGITAPDCVIECVGRGSTCQDAIRYAGKGATVMIFGLTPPDCSIPFLPFEAFRKELTIRTSFVNPQTQGRAVRIVASGKLRLKELIGERIPLKEIHRAFDGHMAGGKMVIIP